MARILLKKKYTNGLIFAENFRIWSLMRPPSSRVSHSFDFQKLPLAIIDKVDVPVRAACILSYTVGASSQDLAKFHLLVAPGRVSDRGPLERRQAG